jgi:hypothetical protein
MKRALMLIAAVALVAAAPATSSKPSGLSPNITNPYWPMKPGTRWVYREGAQKNVVTVLPRTETILGAKVRTVHDVVYENGKLLEDTLDWYAQDSTGTVWYMGEATKEYGGGHVSTAGSWRAGVDGARPGVIVPAHPKIGASYRQEYRKGEAEDWGRNVSVDEQVSVPQGHYDHVFMTRETSALEPTSLEYKYYARGVGPVLAVSVSPSLGFEKLLSFKRGA